jgi:hypothetical protein
MHLECQGQDTGIFFRYGCSAPGCLFFKERKLYEQLPDCQILKQKLNGIFFNEFPAGARKGILHGYSTKKPPDLLISSDDNRGWTLRPHSGM